jgi:hypothetical protein
MISPGWPAPAWRGSGGNVRTARFLSHHRKKKQPGKEIYKRREAELRRKAEKEGDPDLELLPLVIGEAQPEFFQK